jgi:hypothetical protein
MSSPDMRIRTAWRSGEPHALERAAEQLAAEGHEETAIYDALERLLLDERAAGADDATEDRITNVMDRLTGWCHESNHIETNRNPVPDAAGRNGSGQPANGIRAPWAAGSAVEAPPTDPAGG